jgi:predicted protein tyrosine phosphatase
MRLLFICSRNRLRSPTAEQVFAGVCGIETSSAGTSPDAEEQITPELIEWADVILVMEPHHRTKLARQFGKRIRGKRVVCLGIPDDYGYMDAALIQLLWERVPLSVPILLTGRPGLILDEPESEEGTN